MSDKSLGIINYKVISSAANFTTGPSNGSKMQTNNVTLDYITIKEYNYDTMIDISGADKVNINNLHLINNTTISNSSPLRLRNTNVTISGSNFSNSGSIHNLDAEAILLYNSSMNISKTNFTTSKATINQLLRIFDNSGRNWESKQLSTMNPYWDVCGNTQLQL